MAAPGQGEARPGLVGRHSHQPLRGSNLISEHVMPGAQFEAITPGYKETQYPHDITTIIGKPEADIKTHQGPTSDNARTRALKAKIARGERVDVIKDIYLPSIDETVRAHEVVKERTAGTAEQPAGASQAPPSSTTDPALEQSSAQNVAPPTSQAGVETSTQSTSPQTAREFTKVESKRAEGIQAAIDRDKAAQRLAMVPILAQAAKAGEGKGGSGTESEGEEEGEQESGFQRNLRQFSETDPELMKAARVGMYVPGGSAVSAAAFTTAAVHTAQRGYADARREPVIERVNPNYENPPCTPQEIVDVQNQILETLDDRAKTEAASAAMAQQQAHHKANEKPLANMQKGTDDAISATEAHQQAVARRKEANQKKKANEDKASGALSDYTDRAAKLATITVPMRGFERFTRLAYDLPENPEVLPLAVKPFAGTIIRAKHGILKMNTDSKNFLKQLDTMDNTIKDQKATHGERDKGIQADAKTIDDTNKQAADSDKSLNQAKQTTQDLDTTNKERLDQATKIRTDADQTGATLDKQAQAKQAKAQSLAATLDAWAPRHKQARVEALEETKKRLQAQGYKITEVKER